MFEAAAVGANAVTLDDFGSADDFSKSYRAYGHGRNVNIFDHANEQSRFWARSFGEALWTLSALRRARVNVHNITFSCLQTRSTHDLSVMSVASTGGVETITANYFVSFMKLPRLLYVHCEEANNNFGTP